MYYTVERFEDNNIIVLENRDTLEMIEVEKDKLPIGIHEGSILKYKDNEFIEDIDYEIVKRNIIKEKFDRLRND